jgi:imidazolonepropionase-like amidohydrolase
VQGANSHTTWMTDAEVAAAAEEVKMRDKRIIVHARSKASIQQALRHGIDLIYHASFTDTETLDQLEARKDRVFVVPGIGILYALLNEAEPHGVSRATAISWGYQEEWDAALDSLSKMHKRGIRVLPGGDYGFAFNPHLQNARDLEFFVKYLGMTPMEAIRSTTVYGGQIMKRAHELGAVKEGFLADLLLVDGDPLANLSILRDPKRLLAVMKDGVFAKAPEIAASRRWERAA